MWQRLGTVAVRGEWLALPCWPGRALGQRQPPTDGSPSFDTLHWTLTTRCRRQGNSTTAVTRLAGATQVGPTGCRQALSPAILRRWTGRFPGGLSPPSSRPWSPSPLASWGFALVGRSQGGRDQNRGATTSGVRTTVRRVEGIYTAADLAAEGTRGLLEESLTNWYYCEGDGLVVVGETLNVFLKARHNLTCPVEQFSPRRSRPHHGVSDWRQNQERGELAKRQMSLLRTQLKTDLKLYGRSAYGEGLSSLIAPSSIRAELTSPRSHGPRLPQPSRREPWPSTTPHDGKTRTLNSASTCWAALLSSRPSRVAVDEGVSRNWVGTGKS